jgi:EmrB/QacA subfamily drug resistance transporter
MDRRWFVTFNISIGIFMSTVDASVVNISLPTIIQSLNTHLKAAAWVVMAYLIVITGCLLLMGRLSDLFGQRKVYRWGFLIFTVSSALCGFSPSIYFLIGSRMLQGIGSAALMVVGPAILTAAYPEEERGEALGIAGAVVSAGFLAGPILGGFLVEHFGWRSVFFINLPIGAVGIFLCSKIPERKIQLSKVKVDISGALLFFLFITFLFLFLNQVGHGLGHFSLVLLILSPICFALFVAVEIRAPSPLVDLQLFKNRLFASSLGATFLSFWMAGAHSFVVPFFLQNILQFPPTKVGILIFPISLTVMVSAPLGGKISDLVGVRLPATIGLILTSLTVFSFSFLKSGASEYAILWRQVLLGLGIGLFNPANNSAIIGSFSRERIGLATSFVGLSRNLGLVVGVAFAEMVIARASPAAALEKGGPSLGSLQEVWRLVLVMGLGAILLSWSRESRPGFSKHAKLADEKTYPK